MNYSRASLFILLSAAAIATGCSTGEKEKKETLHVVEHADTDLVQHVGGSSNKESVGDILTFANPLYNEANTQKVGNDNGACFRTMVGSAYECLWTAMLAEGQISVSGPFYDDKDSVLAVTGGTGRYKDVRGEMILHARNAQATEYEFTYTISVTG